MTHDEFQKLLERRINLTRKVLSAKSREYASADDKLWNFKRGGEVLGKNQIEVLVGYMTKHLVSVIDLAKLAVLGQKPTAETLDEKIGDLVNYLILLEACITEDALARGGFAAQPASDTASARQTA
jgi:hypothetical protein